MDESEYGAAVLSETARRAWAVEQAVALVTGPIPTMGPQGGTLAVTDHGTPRLTRYQRVIVTVAP